MRSDRCHARQYEAQGLAACLAEGLSDTSSGLISRSTGALQCVLGLLTQAACSLTGLLAQLLESLIGLLANSISPST